MDEAVTVVMDLMSPNLTEGMDEMLTKHSTEPIVSTTASSVINEELTVEDIGKSLDALFLIVNSVMIFFLQGGFAFLEAGSVRSKNTVNILIKNLLDILLACAAFWIFGYMFGYSEGNAFIGTDLG